MCIEYNQLCPETSTWKSKRNRLPTKYPTAAQVTRISDFAIESEIRKRISPPTNLSSCWISITKSKSGFYGFPFYSSIGKSEKGFAKVFSWTVVFFLLSMRGRARPLFLTTVFQILFRISQSNGKNENPKTDISALKSVFGFCVRLQIRNPDFKI